MAENSLKLLKATGSESSPRFYEFGEFRLDAGKRLLRRGDETVPLTPKAFDVLLSLVRRHGRVVTKDELMAGVWPGTAVEENSLNVNVSALRKVFGERPHEHRFIVTVPGVGYEFVAETREVFAGAEDVDLPENEVGRGEPPALEVRREAKGEAVEITGKGRDGFFLYATSASRRASGLRVLGGLIAAGALAALAYGLWARRAETPGRMPPRTIAVLPFKSLSTESRDESLEMGMAETLITKLSNVKQLVVRPTSAVRKYTDQRQDPVEAGQELRAEAVLDGSIQKAGDRVRVTIRLTDVRSGIPLWAGQFDEKFTDIFKVQDAIAERVTQALTLRLSPEEGARLATHYTEDPEAYQLYLAGNYFFSKQTGDRAYNFGKSLEYYRQAVERDPKFARAYVGIAEFYISAGNNLPQWERSPKAKAAVVKALELDDTLAEAHNALAELKYQYEFDWAGAEADFKRAIDLEPNVAYFHLAYSWYHMCLGRFDQAQAELGRAQALEPGSLRINKTQGILFLFMRRYDEAIGHYQKMREVEPTLIHRNQFSMSVAYEQVGMRAEAVEEFLEDGRTRGFLMPEEMKALREAFRASGWQGYVRKRIELLEGKAKKEYVPPTTLAGIHALAGEKEPAFAWLNRAVDTRDPWLSLIKIQPAYDSLRPDPRFTKLLQRVNLTP